MKTFLLAAVLACGFISANAQKNLAYNTDLIPKELLSHANSVVREQTENIEVRDLNSTLFKVKLAVTVLNSNGDEDGAFELPYDKDDAIKYIKGAIYDNQGMLVSKFSESDLSDESVADGFSLFNSERKKSYQPAITQYPYTIVYEYEVRSKQTLDFGAWEPQESTDEAVEKSTLTFSCKPDFNIRFKQLNFPDKPTITNKDAEKNYTWEVTDLKATKHEPLSPYYRNIVPSVQIAPENFSYYGLKGTFTDWTSLGKWINESLLAGRQELPPETIEHVKELTKGLSDPKLKAQKIYEYVQHKTHYVSVQIGLGGLQPFSATDVDQQNYGDCKALVNYTQALLKAAGVESWYCVVEAGSRYKVNMQPDFASSRQGNHIILCLPFKNDTTWVDCTSQTAPFGYLGDFTDDRIVLACTPEGGKLMHTPKYTVDDDQQKRTATFVINASGAIAGTMNTIFTGAEYDDRDDLVSEAFSEQNKALQKIYPINNLVIQTYSLKQDKGSKPFTTETMKLTAKDYASITNGKYYFLLNPANRMNDAPPQVLNRKNDVYINRGITETDEITYIVPDGYKLEKENLNMSLDKPFGKFSATMDLKGNTLTYKRKLQLFDGTYPKDVYSDVVDFFQDIADADSYTVALVKQ